MENQQKMKLLLQLIQEMDNDTADPLFKTSEGNNVFLIQNSLNDLKTISEKIYKTLVSSSRDILNMDEAADYLSVSKSDLYKKTSLNHIKHYKPGKHIYFYKPDLDKYILSCPRE